MAGVALAAARKEATVGFASSSLGFPSAHLHCAALRVRGAAHVSLRALRGASGCFRDPERREGNPRTTGSEVSGGDGRI